MKKNPLVIVYSISLFILGVLAVVTGICGIIGFELPDIAVRIIGIIDIIAAAVLVFAGVRLYIIKKQNKE